MPLDFLLSVQGLKVYFKTPQGLLRAVNDMSFDIGKGEIYGIVGESGSGKSVTALSILRILPPNARIVAGKIEFKGRDLLSLNDRQIRAIRGKEISMVFQDALASFDPVFTIANQIRRDAVTTKKTVNPGERGMNIFSHQGTLIISGLSHDQSLPFAATSMLERTVTTTANERKKPICRSGFHRWSLSPHGLI